MKFSAILFLVSERNTEFKNMKVKAEVVIDRDATSFERDVREVHNGIANVMAKRGYAVDVVCCGCGEKVELDDEIADQWDHGLENFMCWECE